jgi:hypothetical protein
MESAGVHQSSGQFTGSLCAQENPFLRLLWVSNLAWPLRTSRSSRAATPRKRRLRCALARARESQRSGRAWPLLGGDRAGWIRARAARSLDVVVPDWQEHSPDLSPASPVRAALTPASASSARRMAERSHALAAPECRHCASRRRLRSDAPGSLLRNAGPLSAGPPADHRLGRNSPSDGAGQASRRSGDRGRGFPQAPRRPWTQASRAATVAIPAQEAR